MIEAGLFSSVSCEIEGPIGDYAQVMTAVALLGVEQPAVDEATLDRALVFGGKRENARVLSFAKDVVSDADLEKEFNTFKEKAEDIIKGMRGAPIFRAMLANLRTLYEGIKKKGSHSLPPGNNEGVKNNMATEGTTVKGMSMKDIAAKFQIAEADLVILVQALGLDETATIEDILAAIEVLKGGGGGEGDKPVPPSMGILQAEFAKSRTELTKAHDRIAVLERTGTSHDYLEQTRLFTAIPGKTGAEIAVEVTDIHYTQNKEAAEKMLKTYTELNKMGQAALEATGTRLRGSRTGDFEEEVLKFQKDNPTKTRADAVKITMRAFPNLYHEKVQEDRGS